MGIFNFFEKKVTLAELSAVLTEKYNRVAEKELAIFICVSYIANALSKCEFKTYENREEVQGVLWYKLNVSPNANENSSQFINKFVERYYYDGHALLFKHKNMLYCADSFDVDDTKPLDGYTFQNVTVGGQTLNKKFKAHEVFYLKLDNKDVKKLVDGLYADYAEIVDLAIQTFKRTNGKKYKLILDEFRAGDAKFNEIYEKVLKKQLKTFMENDGAIYPQYKGIDLQEFSTATPTTSADIIALRKEIFEFTAQAFKIPMSMMYGNITNMNEIVQVFLSFCVDPLADMVSEELSRKSYDFAAFQKGNSVVVDTSCINHIDILTVGDKVDKAIASGVCCIDDLRKRLGMPPLNTEFSTSHFITKNYDLAERALKNEQGGGKA